MQLRVHTLSCPTGLKRVKKLRLFQKDAILQTRPKASVS